LHPLPTPAGRDAKDNAKDNIIKTEIDKIMTNIGFGAEGIAADTTVVDSEGQKLVLRIDNALGGGGQRKVAIYCPFWIVNTTQHALRYKQEGKGAYVSGTVSDRMDGSRPVDGSARNKKEASTGDDEKGASTEKGKKSKGKRSLLDDFNLSPEKGSLAKNTVRGVKSGPGKTLALSESPEMAKLRKKKGKIGRKKLRGLRLSDTSFGKSEMAMSLSSPTSANSETEVKGHYKGPPDTGVDVVDETIFSGKPGALYRPDGEDKFTEREYEITRQKELPLSRLVKFAFMFNFNDQNVLSMGQQKLCVMLGDTLKGLHSDWSQGYSLDTVGVTQILSMHVTDGRCLELSVNISVAPGRLGQYTKIVRFSPRYVLVNKLPSTISLWQDSSLLHNSFAASSNRWQDVEGGKFIDHRKRYGKGAFNVLFGKDLEKDVVGEDGKRVKISKTGGEKRILFGIHHKKGKEKKGRKRDEIIDVGKAIARRSGVTPSRSSRRGARRTYLHQSDFKNRTGNLIVRTLPTDGFAPFFLPDTRSDRCLRLDLGPEFNCTSSFPADSPGMYTLKLTNPRDPRNLVHVTTRGASHYDVKLPPDDKQNRFGWSGELGVWFETDWDHRGVVVKGCKRGKFAFNHTDIRAGDILISIDGESIGKLSFDDVMTRIKDRLKEIEELGANILHNEEREDSDMKSVESEKGNQIILKFMTLEEKMKKVRKKAFNIHKGRAKDASLKKNLTLGTPGFMEALEESLKKDDYDYGPGSKNLEMTRLKTWEEEGTKRDGGGSTEDSKTNCSGPGGAYDEIAKRFSGVHGYEDDISDTSSSRSDDDRLDYVAVDMSTVGNSLFLYVHPSKNREIPYRIVNSSSKSIISFKQRSCDGHPWIYLKPGESCDYTWEEPMKQRKLALRVRELEAVERILGKGDVLRKGKSKKFFGIENEYDKGGAYGAVKTVKLDEIGSTEHIPMVGAKDNDQAKNVSLWCRVDAEGGTKTLKVADVGDSKVEKKMLVSYVSTIRKELQKIDDSLLNMNRLTRILHTSDRQSMIDVMSSSIYLSGGGERSKKAEEPFGNVDPFAANQMPSNERGTISLGTSFKRPSWGSPFDAQLSSPSASKGTPNIPKHDKSTLKQISEELFHDDCCIDDGNSIIKCNQLLVEVIECCGLKASSLGGLSDPYAEVYLKNHLKKRRVFREKRKRTYFIEKTVHPQWSNQIFVFDVPEEAVKMTRGFSLRVNIRDFELFGTRDFLGQCDVQLNSLAGQNEVMGWYPLTARTGKVFQRSSNDKVSGSVKLRLRWVHKVPTLLDYRIVVTRNRKEKLERNLVQAKTQVKDIEERKINDVRRKHGKAKRGGGGGKKGSRRSARVNKRRKSNIIGIGNGIGNGIKGFERGMKKLIDGAEEEVIGGVRKFGGGIKKVGEGVAGIGKGVVGGVGEGVNFVGRGFKKDDKKDKASNDTRRKDSLFKSGLRMATVSDAVLFANRLHKKKGKKSKKGKANRSKTEVNEEHLEQPTSLSADASFCSNRGSRRISKSNSAHSSRSGDGENFFSSDGDGRETHLSEEMVGMVNNEVQENDQYGYLSESDHSDYDKEPDFASSDYPVGRRRSSSTLDSDGLNYLTLSAGGATQELERRDSDRGLLSGRFDYTDELSEEDMQEALMYREAFDLMKEKKIIHGNILFFHERHKIQDISGSTWAEVQKQGCPDMNLFKTMTDVIVWVNFPLCKEEYLGPEEVPGNSNDKGHVKKEGEEAEGVLEKVFMVEEKDTSFAEINEDDHDGVELAESISKNKLPYPYPIHAKKLALKRAARLSGSRTLFKKAAERSLRNSLMTGGWLTIKPITALNLPDARHNKNVYVRVRFNNETFLSAKADARVAPKWEDEDKDEMGWKTNESHDQNEIKIFVESLKTSGTIELTVLGEKVVETDSELGVLQIPLNGAIDCVGDRFYTRWFPLRSPNDSVTLEGDDGLSSKPLESEKVSDRDFDDFYTSCIKLQLSWETDLDREEDEKSEKELKEENDSIKKYAMLSLGSLSASVIDSKMNRELLTLSVSDFGLRYADTKKTTKIGATVGWFQIDHQLDNTYAPVMLAPTPVASVQPTLQLSVLKDNLRSSDKLNSFLYCGVLVQELDLKVEEDIVKALYIFAQAVFKKQKKRERFTKGGNKLGVKKGVFSNIFVTAEEAEEEKRKTAGVKVYKSVEEDDGVEEYAGGDGMVGKFLGQKIYIEELSLGSVKINVSYIKGSRQKTTASSENEKSMSSKLRIGKNDSIQTRIEKNRRHARELRKEALKGGRVEDDEIGGLSDFPAVISAVIPSLSDAAIRLNGKELKNVFESGFHIANSLKEFYVNEGLKQIYKVIGSLEIIGNPNQLISSLGTGVRDFFYEPALGIVKSPQALGLGLAKGTLSLVSHTTSGVFSFTSKISSQVGSGVAMLSLDDDFKQRHARAQEETQSMRLTRKRDFIFVAIRPMVDIVVGVGEGIKGVVVEPIKGFQKKGAKGLVLGIFVGILGIPAKPIVGLADAFTHASMAFRDVATGINLLEKRLEKVKRRRLPYVFGVDGRLLPYIYTDARCIALIKKEIAAENTNAKREKECVVWSESLKMGGGTELYVMATTERVMCIEVNKGAHGELSSEVKWSCLLPKLASENPLYLTQRGIGIGRRIMVKIENAGHNGVALYIMEGSFAALANHQRRKDNGMGVGLGGGGQGWGVEQKLNAVFGKDEQGNKSAKLGATSWVENEGAGEKRSWGNDLDVNVFCIQAEFQHRQSLLRLNNVVCCLIEDWDGVDEEESGLGQEESLEGVYRFGEWDFIPGGGEGKMKSLAETDGTIVEDDAEEIKEFCESLENATWGRRGDETVLDETKTVLKEDEMITAKADGGARWLIEAHRDAMYNPRFPELPNDVSEDDEQVKSLRYGLFMGLHSLSEVKELLDGHAIFKREQMQEDMEISIEDEWTNQCIQEMADEEEDASVNNHIQLLADQDNDEGDVINDREENNEEKEDLSDIIKDQGVERREEESNATLEVQFATELASPASGTTHSMTNLSSPTSQVSPGVISVLTGGGSFESTNSVLGERLDKVEGMLERLLDAKEEAKGSTGEGTTTHDESRRQIESLLEQIRVLTEQQQNIQQRQAERMGNGTEDETEAKPGIKHLGVVTLEERNSDIAREREQKKKEKRKKAGWWKRMLCCIGAAGATNAVVLQEEATLSRENIGEKAKEVLVVVEEEKDTDFLEEGGQDLGCNDEEKDETLIAENGDELGAEVTDKRRDEQEGEGKEGDEEELESFGNEVDEDEQSMVSTIASEGIDLGKEEQAEKMDSKGKKTL